MVGLPSILNWMHGSTAWAHWANRVRQSAGRWSSEPSSSSGGGSTSLRRSSASTDVSDLGSQSGDNRSNFSFSSASTNHPSILYEPFNPKHQAIIQQEMARCRYGLGWQWQHPKHRMRLQWTPQGTLQFSGYHAKPKAGVLQGDCLQLTLQLGQRLSQRFRGRYKFYQVIGNYPQSPWRAHYFLVAWPSGQNAYFLQKTQGSLNPLSGQPVIRIPKEAFLIDPTYQLMGYAAKHDQLYRYFAIHPHFQDTAIQVPRHTKTHLTFAQGDALSAGLPLGFSGQLTPQHPDPQSVVFAYLKRTPPTSEQSQATLSVQVGWGNQPPKNCSWRALVPPHLPLYPMLKRLEDEAHKAAENAKQSKTACWPW